MKQYKYNINAYVFQIYFRKKYSLNEIAQNSTIKLIESLLEKKIILKDIFVDTIGPADKYQVS